MSAGCVEIDRRKLRKRLLARTFGVREQAAQTRLRQGFDVAGGEIDLFDSVVFVISCKIGSWRRGRMKT